MDVLRVTYFRPSELRSVNYSGPRLYTYDRRLSKIYYQESHVREALNVAGATDRWLELIARQ